MMKKNPTPADNDEYSMSSRFKTSQLVHRILSINIKSGLSPKKDLSSTF